MTDSSSPKWLRRLLLVLVAVTSVFIIALFALGPGLVDKTSNRAAGNPGDTPDRTSLKLHNSLVIGDLHADSALWNRSLLERNKRGHVDVPRLLEGNAALQMFTTVTKSPRGQNYESNSADSGDNITLLGLLQRWPISTRKSLTARALFQAEKVKLAARNSKQLTIVTNQSELAHLISRRAQGERVVGALLGAEGSHALDGRLDAIDELYDAGFRMMSLQHFFDNRLGGSLHGESNAGLTEFGRLAIDRMVERGIMIDVSHSSEAVVRDVLAHTSAPLIVSHTGMKGHCDRKRNISDALIAEIARGGGLIGIGFWEEATCGNDMTDLVGALRYGIDHFGVEAIGLGSDWDGTVTTPIDASQLAFLTHALRQAEFTEQEVRAVMGGNMLRFLSTQLPEA